MKLKNKETGEIMEFDAILPVKDVSGDSVAHLEYNSLAELNAEWEDVSEEEVWYLGEEIGNYALPKEEARKITKKILAWKQLKDKGLHVTTFYVEDGSLVIRAKTHNSSGAENWEDLDLLFGGEDE